MAKKTRTPPKKKSKKSAPDLNSFRATEPRKLSDLKPHPENYRNHPDEEVDQIVGSIKENGFYRNIVVAKDNTILAGHGVVKAAAKMGLTQVPVIALSVGPNDPRALKILTGDNEIAKLAEVDDRGLTDLLKKIMEESDEGLLGTGFSELDLERRLSADDGKLDAAAEWDGMPEFTQEDKLADRQIIVSFRNDEDVQKFAKLVGQKITDKTRSLWFPKAEIDKVVDLRYQEAEAAT